MNKNQEKLLVATLAGLVIAAAAAVAVQPALAAGYRVDTPARVTGVATWDLLNIRQWPASYSRMVGRLEPHTSVWVDRCVVAPQQGPDWCLVEVEDVRGWVNSSYLQPAFDWDI